MRQKITYDPNRDYYTILGIEVQATGEEIRQAYRRCVREVHPDLNPQRADWATEQLQRVNEAYDVLREPALRREYDRQRWLHVPNRPAGGETAYHSPFSTPHYDRDRPWWDQVVQYAPGSYASSDAHRRHPNRRSAPSDPSWMHVSAWLKTHRLTALEPTWLALVGLWRSPYAGVLSVLGVVLSVNVAVIVYMFISPDANPGFLGWLFPDNDPVVYSRPNVTPTPDHLETDCRDPNIQIAQPETLDEVGSTFSVYGTVSHAEMWTYRIEVGYLGTGFTWEAVPVTWQEVRSSPYNQSIPEPSLTGSTLTDSPVDLTNRPAGYYVIRLVVITHSGTPLPACDVVVVRRSD